MDWLTHTFTLPVAISFVIGVTAGQVINWAVRRNRPGRSRLQTVVGVSIVVAMLFIMIATERAHDCAVKLSATITVEQALAAQDRKALQDLFLAAMAPPADIAKLPQDDPTRKAWGQGIGKTYLDTVNATSAQRDANEAARVAAQKVCGR